jgi:hypothetical protein
MAMLNNQRVYIFGNAKLESRNIMISGIDSNPRALGPESDSFDFAFPVT